MVLLLLILAACTPAPGSLKVTIAGLPSGADARVTVSKQGGGFSKEVKKSETLSNLASGTYQISVSAVTAGGYTYSGSPSSTSVKVEGGKQAEVTVTYQASTGGLSVSVAGLPDGASPEITVTGPSGFSQKVATSTTLTGLVPGQYSISAADVSVGGYTYVASVDPATVTVTAGVTATSQVTYGAGDGKLTVRVSGIPGGASATVAVSKVGGGFSQNLTFSGNGSQSLVVPVGQYNIAANPFTVGADTYAGTVSESPVTVTGASTKEVTVSYGTNSGSLQVNISGLPSGSGEPVTVSGPSGTFTLGSSQTLTGLAVGSYTVTAANVSKDGSTYAGTVTTSPVTVSAGATASVSISYAAISGRLVVTIAGLPGGANANVTVTGPGGFSQTLTASATLDNLQPGTYTITPANVSFDGFTYQASGSSATVASGATANAQVNYAAVDGKLTVTISGLPAGTNANVTVSGPGGFSQNLTASTTLTNLTPGTYTITAGGVVVTKTTVDEHYQASGGSASVSAGATASASVTYSKHGSGKLWVIEYGDDNGTPADLSDDRPSRLLGYDQAAGTAVAVDLGLQNATRKARGLALDKAGNVWVGIGTEVSSSSGEIRMYRAADLASPSPSPAVTITGPDLGTPRSLAFDASGNLWVADQFNHTILRFDASRLGANYTGAADYKIEGFGGHMTTPTGLAFDADGNLWVVSFHGTNASDAPSDSPGQILKFKASQLSGSGGYNGRAAMIIYDNSANANDKNSLYGPISLAFDASGRLWVSSKLGDFIARFDVNSPSFPADCDYPGGVITTCSPGTGEYSGAPAVKITANGTWKQPISLAFDNVGNLWVSDDLPPAGTSPQTLRQWNPRMPYFSSGDATGQIIRFNAADLGASGSPAPAAGATLGGLRGPLDMLFNLPASNLPISGRP
ncbi:hypothetical protein [Calidithermus chliarophilus]|uniref:hypothetical protein n=1 Tax=Calidithermus chliarophilus TaxID=52023 RepID=UPI0012F6FC5D|nr:hypothetical protein [Calidithermus chliarophilus]